MLPIRKRISLAIVNDLTQYFASAIGQVVKNTPDIDLSLRVRRSPETIALVIGGEVDLGISEGLSPVEAIAVEGFARTLAETPPEALTYLTELMRKQGIRAQ